MTDSWHCVHGRPYLANGRCGLCDAEVPLAGTSKRWYSICSAHQEYVVDCSQCNAGVWIDEDDPEVIADRALWNSDHNAWREKHTGDPLKFTDREGNVVRPFPRLIP